MSLNLNDIQRAAEAVLFACGEPVELERLSEALLIEPDELEPELDDLRRYLDKTKSGLMLLRLGDKYQLATREMYADNIRIAMDKKRNAPLSQAAFEVLAIVAYNQPVTKSFVEQIRGVDCSGVMATLTQKELIEEAGRLDLPGRPLIYKTTANFMRCFGISDLSELPEIPDAGIIEDEEIGDGQVEGQISFIDDIEEVSD